MAFPQTAAPTETELDTAGTTINVNMPATVNANALLLMFIAYENANLGVPDPGTPSGWTLKYSVSTNSSKDAFTVCYAKVAAGTEDGGTVAVTTSMNCVAAAHVYHVTDWDGALTGVEVATASNAANNAPNPPSLTASWGTEDNLWFAVSGIYVNLGTVNSYSSGFTGGVQTNGGDTTDGASIASCRLESAATTVDPGVWALSETERHHTNTIVVRPGTAGGAGMTGTVAVSLQAPTVSGSGWAEIIGSVAASLQPVVVSASGALEISGSATVTLSATETALAGWATVTGEIAAILAAIQVAASGAEEMSGTVDVSLQAIQTALEGWAGITGTGEVTLQAVTTAAAGEEGFTGTVTVGLSPITTSASGWAEIIGEVAAQLESLVVAAEGEHSQSVTGTITVTLSAVTVDASGNQTAVGTSEYVVTIRRRRRS